MKELTKKDVLNYNIKLTVGQLKKFIEENNFSDDSIVLIQRIEDYYYKSGGWGVYLKKGDFTHQLEKTNEKIRSGKISAEIISDEQIKASMEEYSPATMCVRYQDDKDILFINLHY